MTERTMRKVGLVVFWLVASCTPRLDDAALQELCARAVPSWSSYDEDLKAQVGATPVAVWEGDPVEITQDEDALRVRFEIRGPWAELRAQLPVLLRLPTGEVARSSGIGAVSPWRVEYRFEAGPEALPWVELRYPGHERRFSLSEGKKWRAG